MIKPTWAATIWCDADHIYAELNGHTIKVSNDKVGLGKILTLAKARSAKSRLGEKGDPTQWQIDKPTYDESRVRRARKIEYTDAQRMSARDILRKLNLI